MYGDKLYFYLEGLLNLPHIEEEKPVHKPSDLSVDWIKVIGKLLHDCNQKLTNQ